MATTEQLAEAARWAAKLYEERTVLVGNDRGDVLMINPSTRVSWHEIRAQFPDISGPDDRVEFQPFFNREIRKLKLWRVLQGKETALDWCKAHRRIQSEAPTKA